ncbi:MAG TPA: hypothetical protein VM638_08380, partial [Actinomycetota bacterium]|nr:hypothetical protein [Actinomycetota bacterium]
MADPGPPRGFRERLETFPTSHAPVRDFRRLIRSAAVELAALDRPSLSADHDFSDFRVLVPAGDLDGDGREDALDLSERTVAGVKGTNGATIWNQDYDGWGILLGTGALDALAGTDLITLEVLERDINAGYHWTMRVRGRSGRTGQILWTRSYENLWTVGRLGSTTGYVDTDFALPLGVGKLSTDAAPDVLVGRYNIARTSTPGASESGIATLFEAVSGANGVPLGSFPGAGRFGVPDAVIVPDLSNDGADDVVTVSVVRSTRHSSFTARLSAFPGSGGAPVWRRDIGGMFEQPYLVGHHLNGDGRGDLLVVEYGWYALVQALSGTNGSTLWADAYWGDPWITAAGSATGPGQDLLMISEGSGFGVFAAALPTTSPDPTAKVRAPELAPSLGLPALPGHDVVSSPYGCDGEDCPDPCYGYGPGCPPEPCYGGGYGCEPSCPGGYGYAYAYSGGGGCSVTAVTLIEGATGEWEWNREILGGYSEPAGDATGDGVVDV